MSAHPKGEPIMTLYTNLFDTRGGSMLAHRCEICNDELDHEADSPTCEDCTRPEEEEG
jgi:hypothetical protein